MGSIQQGEEQMINEKKKETVADFLKRGGKVTKVKGGTGKAGKDAVSKFKKSYGRMNKKEAELDAKDKAEREKEAAREEAETMNKYMKVLEQERHVNLWAEAKRVNMFPPPVDGKKTMTGKPQNKAIINPKENE